MPTATATELSELQLPGQPFDGLNIEKAKIVNGALIGYEVQIHGVRDFEYGWKEGRRLRSETYVFKGLALPGDQARTIIDEPYDLCLQKGRRGGSQRMISASLVSRFEVVGTDELTPCVDCGLWQPMWALKDTAYSPLDMLGYGLICRKNCSTY